MSRWIHGFSGSESITIITYFDAQNVPDLVTGSSFGLASVLFWDISCHSLSTFFFLERAPEFILMAQGGPAYPGLFQP